MSDSPSGGFRLPSRVDRVLLYAARNPDFLADLQRHRSQAALDAGFELTSAERAVLDATSPEQLAKMIEKLPEAPAMDGTRPEDEVLFGGIRPDQEPVYPMHSEPTRGTRPLLPLAAAAAAGTVLLGGAAASLMIVTGSRPDVPPSVESPVSLDADGGAGAGGDSGADADADADAEKTEPTP